VVHVRFPPSDIVEKRVNEAIVKKAEPVTWSFSPAVLATLRATERER
jgi:hypothetical protein